jgi:hypothetical protein
LSDLDVCFAEALAYTASLTPGVYTTFQRHLDPSWIEEALAAPRTATRYRCSAKARVTAVTTGLPDDLHRDRQGPTGHASTRRIRRRVVRRGCVVRRGRVGAHRAIVRRDRPR